jgi:hypothetical protein
MLADELGEAERAPAPSDEQLLARIADRLEALASALEQDAPAP